MSDNKVNSKMLKDLIKEVLAEQKLDEKNVKGITLNDLQPYINKSGKTGGQYYKKAKTKQDFSTQLDPASTRVVKTVKQVAGKGGDKKAIDTDDLSKSGIDATFKAAWSDAIKNKGKTVATTGSPPSSSKSKTQLKQEIYDECTNIKSKNDTHHKKAKQLLADLKKLYAGTANPKGFYAQAKKEIADTLAALATSKGSTTAALNLMLDPLDASYSQNTGITFSDITRDSPFGRINPAGMDAEAEDLISVSQKGAGAATASGQRGKLQAQIRDAQFDQSIINQMSVFTSTTIEGKLQELEDAAEILGNAATTGTIPGNPSDKLKLAAKLNVLTHMTNGAKTYGSSAGGFIFETFCAAFFNGIGAGDANGAIDVALGGKDGKGKATMIPTSQKLISSATDVTQARGGAGGIGLDGILEEYGRILYFVGRKYGASSTGDTEKTNYKTMKIYVLDIRYDGGSVSIHNLDAAGSWTDTGDSLMAGKTIISDSRLDNIDPVCTLALLNSPDSSANAIANEVYNAVKTDPFLKQLSDIFARLENIERNTQSYEATGGKASSQSATGQTAQDYVKTIGTEYSDLKQEFKDVFTTADSSIDTTSFKEGKKITSKMLKKLFKETLNK